MIVAVQATTIRVRRLNSQREKRTMVLRSQIEGWAWSVILGHYGSGPEFASGRRNRRTRRRRRFGDRRLDQLQKLPAVFPERHQELSRRGRVFLRAYDGRWGR